MARRDRTTGLPRHRPRQQGARERGFLGVEWTERRVRYAVLGAVGLLLAVVLGLIGYRWYDENIGKPNEVILTVGDEEFTLGYYADRLLQFAQANPNTGSGFLEQGLLNKLEEEGLTLILAEQLGLRPSQEEVTQAIADELGVPVGGPGSSFDTLYRQRLKSTGMSDGNYRRLSEASAANDNLLAHYREEIGTTGETVTLRVVVVESRERADEILGRIEDGEDMGTIAQTDSADLESRQQDGLMQATPPQLLPENVKTAVEEQEPGTLVGPVEVQDNFWVARLEERDPESSLTNGQQGQLAELRLQEELDQLRSEVTINRDLGSDEIDWALRHANDGT